MKHIRKWLRILGGALLEFLGRFRLLTIFTVILVVSIILFSISLYHSNRIAKGLIRTEYQEYNETIFRQTETILNRSIQDLTQLCYTFMSNQTVVDYLEDQSFDGRMQRMDEIKAEFDRLIAVQEDIKSIYLYNLEGKMVASAGTKYYPSGGFRQTESITFTGLMTNDGMRYFGVHIPVFDVRGTRNARKVGYCELLVSMDFVEKSLERVLPNNEFFFLALDSSEQIMLQRGDIPQAILPPEADPEERMLWLEEQVLYRAALSSAPWYILFGVPQEQLYASINLLQQNYLVTYFSIGVLLLGLFVAVYAGVFRPIRNQIHFMNYYARNRTSRMKTSARNEMGELARNLNRMLDDIDQLTAENVRAQQHVLEAKYQKKQSELFAYRNQVNPHFLRNTFECIRGMALYYQVEDIAAITESLSDLFSYNLLGKGYAPVKDVKAHIDDYTSIIRYRFNNRYTISTAIDQDAEDVIFPKMIIQPLVENAIFHGLETVEQGGTVSVRIRRSEDGKRLRVSVEDNGLGIPEEALSELREALRDYDRTNDFPNRKHGIGIINIYRRLRLFYGDRLDFAIESAYGAGTAVHISVPCDIQVMEDENVPGFFD